MMDSEKVFGGLMAVAALVTFTVASLGAGLGLYSALHFAVLMIPVATLAAVAFTLLGDD
jgi:hypothetical protein